MDCRVCQTREGHPKRLQCGHTDCQKCTQCMLESSDDEQVQCQVCGQYAPMSGSDATTLTTTILQQTLQHPMNAYSDEID